MKVGLSIYKKYKWVLKLVLQKIISLLPLANQINYYFSRTFGWLRKDIIAIRSKEQVNTVFRMLKIINSMGCSIKNKKILELGTGWHCMFPILLSAYSPEKIITIDKTRHIRNNLFQEYFATISELSNNGLPSFDIDKPHLKINPMISNLDVDDFLLKHNISYLAPADARHTNINSNTIDFIYSFSVFEHIPTEILDAILLEFHRILKPSGIMFHIIEPEDHAFQYGASRVEFLKYSSTFFTAFINNSVSYHNRLRDSEHKKLFEKNKFEVIWHDKQLFQEDIDKLKTMDVSSEFSSFNYEDLAISKSAYILKKVGENPDIISETSSFKWFSSHN